MVIIFLQKNTNEDRKKPAIRKKGYTIGKIQQRQDLRADITINANQGLK